MTRFIYGFSFGKALPNSDRDVDKWVKPSCFTSLKYELGAYSLMEQLTNSLEGMFSPGVLWVKPAMRSIQ